MGIKFRCPNGHKLNVKEIDPATGRRVVGKVGYCPKCGARFRIPPSGQAVLEPSDSSVLDDAAPLSAPDDSGMLVSAQGPPGGNRTRGGMAGHAPGTAPRDSHSRPAAAASYPSAPAPAPGAWPPIDEAPEAIWYVRPPTGGQYGPARGDVMRQWLQEGRVPQDALVWREGWSNWETAGSVFPGLAQIFGLPPVVAGPQATPSAPPQATGGAAKTSVALPSVRASGRRQKGLPAGQPASQGRRGWRVVGVLAGLCAVLLVVLVYLLVALQ
jgi:hypothetical protein